MRRRRGFTQVEINIVLAIVAAILVIAVPSVLIGDLSARKRSDRQSLQLIEKAIELYAADHDGQWPGQENDLARCLSTYFPEEDIRADADRICGGAVAYAGAKSKNGKWLYDPESGTIRINSN